MKMNRDEIMHERQKVARAKEIIRETQSPYLKRDLQKYVKRTEREIARALRYMNEVRICHEEPTQTASRT